jgi:acetylglutamate kinase
LPTAAEAVLTFLESVGRRSEAELYLGMFQKLPKESFALVVPAASAVRQGLGSLSEQLRFLTDLGLSAPIVLGLFEPAAAEPLAERLQRRLASAGLTPVPYLLGAADPVESLRQDLTGGKTPVARFAVDGELDLAGRFRTLARLASALDTRKLVLVRARGALKLASDRREAKALAHLLAVEAGAVSLVNLRTDAELLLGERLLRREDAELLEHVAGFLREVEPRSPLVSITSPLSLLTELFTVRGAGTLVKRGSAIQRLESYAQADLKRLEALLEASFGHELRDELFSRPPLALFLEEEYRGAAIVEPTEVAPYLSKFAVEPVVVSHRVRRHAAPAGLARVLAWYRARAHSSHRRDGDCRGRRFRAVSVRGDRDLIGIPAANDFDRGAARHPALRFEGDALRRSRRLEVVRGAERAPRSRPLAAAW